MPCVAGRVAGFVAVRGALCVAVSSTCLVLQGVVQRVLLQYVLQGVLQCVVQCLQCGALQRRVCPLVFHFLKTASTPLLDTRMCTAYTSTTAVYSSAFSPSPSSLLVRGELSLFPSWVVNLS